MPDFQSTLQFFVGAKPKKVGKLSFLQHFTVFQKKFPFRIFSYLHGVKEGHFLISKPLTIMVVHFFLHISLPDKVPSKLFPKQKKKRSIQAMHFAELCENTKLFIKDSIGLTKPTKTENID